MTNQIGILEKTKNIITDPNETLDENATGAPFVLVALGYLAILAVACGMLAFATWMIR